MADKEEYVQIDMKMILLGLIAGVIASLWTIVPFFFGGVNNLLYATVGLGLIFLLMFMGFGNKKRLIKSCALAVSVFFLFSYLIVPGISGFLISGTTIDTSKYENGKYETVNLALPGLFCQGCAYSSQKALEDIPGVVDAKVYYDDKKGVVIYDSDLVTPETIVSNGLIQGYGGKIIND